MFSLSQPSESSTLKLSSHEAATLVLNEKSNRNTKNQSCPPVLRTNFKPRILIPKSVLHVIHHQHLGL